MEVSYLVHRGNTLKVTFAPLFRLRGCIVGEIVLSPEFSICGCATFQVKAIIMKIHNNSYKSIQVAIRFFKNCQIDELTYSITFSSDSLCIKEKTFMSDDGTWHLIMDNLSDDDIVFDISIVMDTVHVSTFETLYDDTELTDFELRGEDGSVKVHKAVLAASSDVLRRMLSGSWRETTEGHVDVPGTSAQTLQHFKDAIYLNTLPQTGLEQILLLASYYMIPNLEQKCVNELMNSLTAQNVCDMIEFAAKHKINRLVLAIVHSGCSGELKANDMRQNFLSGQDNSCEK